ncbi:MAG: Na/Pi cotransporter family protein [Bacteroidetes bacterium]|nr:Na/Pi cotransporter family protein [Bacteroidota bacterium]
MSYTIWNFLELLGSLGIFIFGMKIMSEGLQNAAGSRLRKILGGMTSTRFTGVLTGFLITSAVQSSSATTVMVISFVNAGLLTLGQSLGVIMGANVGTTLTIWIVALLGFKTKITVFAKILTGVAFPFLFSKRTTWKYMAEFVLGFCILFIGLDFLKQSVPDVQHNPGMLAFFQNFTQYGYGSILLFIGIGTLLTIVVQSSSAATTITLVMMVQGWIDFEIAAAMVLGENIGTTVTANIAALIANVHAKRAARFHLIFNVIGVIWMLLVFYPFIEFVNVIALKMEGILSSLGLNMIDDNRLALSVFHSMFNLLNVFLFIWFVKYLEKLVIKIQPSKGIEDEFKLEYISTGLLSTPELSIEEAKKEIQLFGKILDKLCLNDMALFFEKVNSYSKLMDKIKQREEITDRLEVEITNYLGKISQSDISPRTSDKIRSMMRMVNDMERIGDIFYQLMKTEERMRNANFKLSDELKKELNEMFDLIYNSIKRMRINLDLDPTDERIMKDVYIKENEINNLRDTLQKNHFKRFENQTYGIEEGILYLDFVNSLEKIGDHVVNINEAIVGIK